MTVEVCLSLADRASNPASRSVLADGPIRQRYIRRGGAMNSNRSRLPQLDGGLFLTDGGIETTLIYQEGFDLPFFAAFPLLRSERGITALRRYYTRHASIARERGVRFVLESATWRASADWGVRLGYSARELAAANRAAIDLLHDLRRELETDRSPMVVSGCV